MTTSSTTTKYPRGAELARQVMNQILQHPESWHQGSWHCGSAHCFGGWCQIMGGRPQNSSSAACDARQLLGIDAETAEWLFDPCRSISDLHAFASAAIAGKAGTFLEDFCVEGFHNVPNVNSKATAKGLRDFLASEGLGQNYLVLIDALPESASASDAMNAITGGRLGHRYLERAIAYVNSNGHPEPEPPKAWNRNGFDRNGFSREGERLPLL